MIIKGKSRSGAAQLGPYLKSAEVNERVEVIEVRGTIAEDVEGAILEMDAYAEGTQCEKSLYHAQISPEPPYVLTPEQRIQAIDALEKELGLDDHARVAVIHQKHGREHIHVVWTRIDLETMTAVHDGHNYRKHENVSRKLERLFGHPRVQGAHAERDEHDRPNRSPSRSELRQEERTGIKGADVREEVTALFRLSDNAEAFRAALEEKDYLLAQGDRRDFVVVDRAGGIHSLARRIEGMKAAELREFMKPLIREHLPSATDARDLQLERQQGRPTTHDSNAWEDELLKAALGAEEKDRREKADNRAALAWDDKLHENMGIRVEAEDKLERERLEEQREIRREIRAENSIAKGYAGGEDYVSQSMAALKDHKLLHTDVGDERPTRPDDDKREEELLRRQAEETTKRQQAQTEVLGPRSESVDSVSGEMTDAKQAHFERLLNAIHEEDRSNDRDDPDRQREAPGGGRTRSR